MNYELLNGVNTKSPIWEKVQKRLKDSHGTLISLPPEPNFSALKKSAGFEGFNLVDYVTRRNNRPNEYRFFNEVDVPDFSKVDVNYNGTVSVIYDGNEIGQVRLFPNTRRHVQELRYFNRDGSLDWIEEYASDGEVFSNIFYSENTIQEIVFVNKLAMPVLRYYFYEGQINHVTIENPMSHRVEHAYNSQMEFRQEMLAQIFHVNDTVAINFLGLELDVLSKTKSKNILYLNETPLDESGQIRGNLARILSDDIKFVQTVYVTEDAYQKLQATGVSMIKVKVLEG